jgi:hypothetical protein
VRHRNAGIDKQDNGEARGDEEQGEAHNLGDEPPVKEARTFTILLEVESDKPREERLSCDLWDEVTKIREEQIPRQCSQAACNEQEGVIQVRYWWFDDDTVPAGVPPDTYWRERHGNPAG